MAKLRLFSVFHLNLAFSSVSVAQRAQVVERCYWPLLRLIERTNVATGIEITGLSLEWLSELDASWVRKLRSLAEVGLVELVGSGRTQLIGPLVPWRVNAANLRWGLDDYRRHLGIEPVTLLVNEQTFSRASVGHALDAGFRHLVIEWENAWRANPSWPRTWGYATQRLRASDGREATLLWNQSIAFQKVQRFAHGEFELDDMLSYIDAQRGPEPRAFCVYGSDAEVFGFRPGRFLTEARLEHDEWQRLGELYSALSRHDGVEFVLPSTLAELDPHSLGGHVVEPQSAAEPIPTKKQGKYNVTRWAVTGRDDLAINTACERVHEGLVDVPLDDPRWRELCDLWSSDFRTHITDERWESFRARLGEAVRRYGVRQSSFPRVESSKAVSESAVAVEQGRRFVRIRSERIDLVLDARKGLCIHDLSFPSRSPLSLMGTIPHGTLEDVRWSADWFSGHLVFETPGKPKVTDLEPVSPEVRVESDAVVVSAIIETPLGPIGKSVTAWTTEERIVVSFELKWPVIPVGSLRLAHVLLKPDAWDSAALRYRTHLGGKDFEEFRCGDESFDHGDPVSFLVSASTAIGMTEGVVDLGDDQRMLRVEFPKSACAAVGSMTHRRIGQHRFFRFCASLREMDDTTQKAATKLDEPLRFAMTIRPVET